MPHILVQYKIMYRQANTDFSCFVLDLNVEHLQLFLFIFHNFSMTQRKAILTYCAEVLIVVANSTSVLHGVPVAICRLLQLLDYFLHHLSVPPQDLFKQVFLCFVSTVMYQLMIKVMS